MSASAGARTIFDWIQRQRGELKLERPLVVGISAPQGAGKTTLTSAICELAKAKSLDAVSVSIDDFYLTRSEQVQLAKSYPDNPYLQHRGYPLTHDVHLGTQTIESLLTQSHTRIPRYDKTAHSGKGDRFDRADWPLVGKPADLILFEGWMLGFQKVAESHLPNPNFKVINDALPSYRDWTAKLDAFVWLEPSEISDIVAWRVEAEQKMRDSGNTGMSDVEARAYIETFIPAYETYLPKISSSVLAQGPFLHMKIQRDRTLV